MLISFTATHLHQKLMNTEDITTDQSLFTSGLTYCNLYTEEIRHLSESALKNKRSVSSPTSVKQSCDTS
jgi:hypothetical protein